MNKIQTYYLFKKIRDEYCKTCKHSCLLKKEGEIHILNLPTVRGYVEQWEKKSCSYWTKGR